MWTKKEVADYLKVSVRQVDILREKRGLPWLLVGNLVRFRKEDIENWVKKQNA